MTKEQAAEKIIKLQKYTKSTGHNTFGIQRAVLKEFSAAEKADILDEVLKQTPCYVGALGGAR